jgi:ABC-type transport system involved in multi-copper enzyme maturation permease subunit
MNPRLGLATLTLLIQDTFRQACATGIFWIMLAVTGVCALLCLSVNISGDVRLRAEDEPGLFLPKPSRDLMVRSVVAALGGAGPLDTAVLAGAAGKKVWFALEYNPQLAEREGIPTVRGQMTLAFGTIPVPLVRERRDAVVFLELVLGFGVAGVLGVLLALVWTAGFAPSFLDPSAASVLLAKPVARWQLLLGKYIGVLVFLGFQVVLFVLATWLALGLSTDVWDLTYWWSIPLLLLQFAVFYSFSLLVAVATRSTAACIVGAVLFWLLGWAINYGCATVRALPEQQGVPAATHTLAEVAYWISPKPIDSGLILFNALDPKEEHFKKQMLFGTIESGPGFSPGLSILSSLLILLVLLALSAYEFAQADY